MKPSKHDAEELVRELPDVQSCCIEFDSEGAVLRVEIRARPGAVVARLVEDVRAVLAEEVHLEVAPERIDVRSSAEAGLALETLEIESRVRLLSYSTAVSDERTLVEAELGLGTSTAIGRAEARGAASAPELLAAACLDAVEKLCGGRVTLRLAGWSRTQVAGVEILCVTVQEARGRSERLLVGAARNDGDPARAAAHAALDGVNRRLGRILADPPPHFEIS